MRAVFKTKTLNQLGASESLGVNDTSVMKRLGRHVLLNAAKQVPSLQCGQPLSLNSSSLRCLVTRPLTRFRQQ